MELFYSELCLIGGDVGENVDRLVANGADNIELMLDGAGWDSFHLRIKELAGILNAGKVGYSVHVPVWEANLTSENAEIRAAVLDGYRHSLDLAAEIGARHVVLHPGVCADRHFSREVARKRARQAMLELLEYNRSYGLLLLVENIGTPAKSIFTESEFISFLDGFPPGIGYIVDIGHAHISGWNIPELLYALGDRLYALHLHDNDGNSDAHAPIGQGNIDWKAIFAAATGTGRNLNLVLEYNIGTQLSWLVEGKRLLEEAFPRWETAGESTSL